MNRAPSSRRRVATVVRVRRLQERLATAEVARRQVDRIDAEGREAATWRLVETRAEPAGATAAEFRAGRSVLADGVAAARRAGEAADRAREDVREALSSWEVAARRRDGIERLDERLLEADRRERERQATIELDDFVVTRWDEART
ncbi:MAG: hypothetical protein QNJ12_01655 [Ilumatobacter sp.]|uniref:hypothetical protein n=1 Tax=Ilumatobacter sp. TaxID=1967498 RepID=UPI00261C9159|nr:hypothetical protein [Ilumatobacter sp.]MDJ0767460.1 hypothetical protein [Ilumatobacter sp.]